jgi:hypothetical protein
MLRFIGRSFIRFFGGIVWLALLAVLAVFVLALYLLGAATGLCLGWSAVNCLLYLASHRHDIGQQALYSLIAGAVGFGIIVAIQGALWEAWRALRDRSRLSLAFNAPETGPATASSAGPAPD